MAVEYRLLALERTPEYLLIRTILLGIYNTRALIPMRFSISLLLSSVLYNKPLRGLIE
jgi:hypothetical protein